jgi:hypothetical protein
MVSVFRGALELTDDDVTRLLPRKTTFRHIFNPDKRRMQAPVKDRCEFASRLCRVLHEHMDGRSLGSMVVLKSEPGCKQQAWHTDYDPDIIKSLHRPPMGVMVALQDDTLFEVYPHTQHTLMRGDVLVFEGGVVHAGAAYNRENVRIHAYLDSNECRRDWNHTYLLSDRL